MRIVYLSTDPGIPVGGVKGAAIHLRSMAAALVAQGHAVRVLAARRGAEPTDLGGAELEVWPVSSTTRRFAPLGQARACRAEAEREQRQIAFNHALALRAQASLATFRPDAIYERYALFGTAGGRLARQLGVPHLLEVNAPLCDEQARHRQLCYAQVARRVEQRVLCEADRVFVVSNPLADWARDLGVRPEHLSVMPNGVDADRFAPAPALALRLRAQLGIAPEACVVGFCGSLKPWHDLPTLLAGFAEARRLAPGRPMALLVLGDGPGREGLAFAAARMGLAHEVHLPGSVPHAQVPGWLAAMDLAVAPYPLGGAGYFSPLKLFEYMAAGRAVLASTPGQAAEVIVEGQNGRLYPAGDAPALGHRLAELACDPAARAGLGQAARETVIAGHSWAVNASGVVAAAASIGARRRAVSAC